MGYRSLVKVEPKDAYGGQLYGFLWDAQIDI